MVDLNCEYRKEAFDDGIVYNSCIASCRSSVGGLSAECDSDNNLECEWALKQRRLDKDNG